MWDFYVDSIRENRVNAYESAIKAGYAEDTAKNITLTGWYKERLEDLERKDMLSKAEKKLAKTLTYEVEDTETGKVQTDLLRIQVDVSKHLTSTLGKDKGYSSRTEQTGKDGKDLIPPTLSEEEKEKLNKLL
jgi:phage terminase small subunit